MKRLSLLCMVSLLALGFSASVGHAAFGFTELTIDGVGSLEMSGQGSFDSQDIDSLWVHALAENYEPFTCVTVADPETGFRTIAGGFANQLSKNPTTPAIFSAEFDILYNEGGDWLFPELGSEKTGADLTVKLEAFDVTDTGGVGGLIDSAEYTLSDYRGGDMTGETISLTQNEQNEWDLPFNSVYVMLSAKGSTTTCIIPAPGAILLGSLGAGLVGWLRRRRAL